MTGETTPRFVKIEDDWHLIADTRVENGMNYRVTTACGIDQVWDQTFVDRLPGGGETTDESIDETCRAAIGGQATPAEAPTNGAETPRKRTTKAKA